MKEKNMKVLRNHKNLLFVVCVVAIVLVVALFFWVSQTATLVYAEENNSASVVDRETEVDMGAQSYSLAEEEMSSVSSAETGQQVNVNAIILAEAI